MFEGLEARLKRRMGASIVDQTCPYCFDRYRMVATPFRCTNPRCPKKEKDEVRARVWEEKDPRGLVLPETDHYRETAICPECSQQARQRLCPVCHMELPHTAGQFRNLIIAVIGAKETGKSHYIAVLIEHFRKRLGPELGMLLEPLDDRTIKRYREDFHAPVYIRRTTIEATKTGLADHSVQMPLVYSLTSQRRGALGGTRVVTLVFFDTAGEDLDETDRISVVNKYIFRADGIILLLDPLQLDHVRSALPPSTALPARNTETADIIQRVTTLIRGGRGLTAADKVSTPLALAFSKFDALESIVDPQLQLFRDADHRKGYDRRDFEAVNAEMQSLLAEWDSRYIQQQVSMHYETFGYFGLTALGCNPQGTGSIPRVAPRRIEDPLMWLLHHHGELPGGKGWRSPARYVFLGLAAVFTAATVRSLIPTTAPRPPLESASSPTEVRPPTAMPDAAPTPVHKVSKAPPAPLPTRESERPTAPAPEPTVMSIALAETTRAETEAEVPAPDATTGVLVVRIHPHGKATLNFTHLPDGGQRTAERLFFTGLAPEAYQLKVFCDGYESVTQQVSIVAGEARSVEVSLVSAR